MQNNPCPNCHIPAFATMLIANKIHLQRNARLAKFALSLPVSQMPTPRSSPPNQGQCVYLRPKSASIRVCQSLSWNKTPGLRGGWSGDGNGHTLE